MSRFSRISTIWRKELVDTLRDRRTVIAMVLVPLVLYPAMMLGSLQAVEVQLSQMQTEKFAIAVNSDAARVWLRTVIDSDPARREDLDARSADERLRQAQENPAEPARSRDLDHGPPLQQQLRAAELEFSIVVAPDVRQAVASGECNVGVEVAGDGQAVTADDSLGVTIIFDETDVRSRLAGDNLNQILQRARQALLDLRLQQHGLDPSFLEPLALESENIASPERMAGSAMGQIIPLILVLMTITGAIYPAIDLTAGERERGTLETLMAAPVPTLDLVIGKFIVVTLIGLLSAVLNLASMGGTIYFGGVGAFLLQGSQALFPLWALPIVLLLLIPLAVMFSALLLAVCSFARSFKEAQNYIVPVMMVAMIPGVVGILPGTRLEGPVLIMPVANLVVLTRELFLGKLPIEAIVWVGLSTCLYAGAAVAIAARLFGQEAVLFADSGSIRTLFQRRFFKPASRPSAAVALLLVTIAYTLNFYIQQSIAKAGFAGLSYLVAIGLTVGLLLGVAPLLAAGYLRIRPASAFALRAPRPAAVLAAMCFGLSTWVLIQCWFAFQSRWLRFDPGVLRAMEAQLGWIQEVHPAVLIFFLALLPAVCEELFFRGFVLSGLRDGLHATLAVGLAALAFGLFHYSAMRIVPTALLGIVFGVLVVRYGSIWPAILAHLMHNSLTILSQHPRGLGPLLREMGMQGSLDTLPPVTFIVAAAALAALGLALVAFAPAAATAALPDARPPTRDAHTAEVAGTARD